MFICVSRHICAVGPRTEDAPQPRVLRTRRSVGFWCTFLVAKIRSALTILEMNLHPFFADVQLHDRAGLDNDGYPTDDDPRLSSLLWGTIFRHARRGDGKLRLDWRGGLLMQPPSLYDLCCACVPVPSSPCPPGIRKHVMLEWGILDPRVDIILERRLTHPQHRFVPDPVELNEFQWRLAWCRKSPAILKTPEEWAMGDDGPVGTILPTRYICWLLNVAPGTRRGRVAMTRVTSDVIRRFLRAFHRPVGAVEEENCWFNQVSLNLETLIGPFMTQLFPRRDDARLSQDNRRWELIRAERQGTFLPYHKEVVCDMCGSCGLVGTIYSRQFADPGTGRWDSIELCRPCFEFANIRAGGLGDFEREDVVFGSTEQIDPSPPSTSESSDGG